MITLITGSPGSGKTLYCVDKILQPLVGSTIDSTNEEGETTTYNRTIYTNIPRLLLDHELIDAKWLEHLHENKQTGCVVVFDEVQRAWPNRPHGSKKPAAVEYLETHRHDGIDIVLMTQNPMLLDPAVRALVGRHLHIRRLGGFGGAIVYEWDSCSNSLNFKAAFTKTPYRYNRKVFKLYHSADVHTRQNRNVPFAAWVVLGGILASVYMWPHFMGRVFGDDAKAARSGKLAAASAPMLPASAPSLSFSDSSSGTLAVSSSFSGVPAPLTAAEYSETFRPRLNSLPHTAPRYDELTKPSRVRYPAACIQGDKYGCKCFDQEGVHIYIRDSVCRDIVKNGLFLDFKPEPTKPNEPMSPISRAAGGEPTTLIISPSSSLQGAPRSGGEAPHRAGARLPDA